MARIIEYICVPLLVLFSAFPVKLLPRKNIMLLEIAIFFQYLNDVCFGISILIDINTPLVVYIKKCAHT